MNYPLWNVFLNVIQMVLLFLCFRMLYLMQRDTKR